MPKIYLSIIIPAFQEALKIRKDIRKAEEFLAENNLNGEVIVSTDKKTDPTNQAVYHLQKEFKNLYLVTDNHKPGKGTALKKGVKFARGKYIMFADAGYCVPFKFSKLGIKLLEDGYNLAIGSRAIKSSKIKKYQPFYRQLGSKVFRLVIIFFLNIPWEIKDTQCGFKIYKSKVAKRLFNNLQTASNMFDIELILRAKKYNFSIGQFPVEWSNDPDTKLKPFSGTFKILRDLYRIKKLKLRVTH